MIYFRYGVGKAGKGQIKGNALMLQPFRPVSGTCHSCTHPPNGTVGLKTTNTINSQLPNNGILKNICFSIFL